MKQRLFIVMAVLLVASIISVAQSSVRPAQWCHEFSAEDIAGFFDLNGFVVTNGGSAIVTDPNVSNQLLLISKLGTSLAGLSELRIDFSAVINSNENRTLIGNGIFRINAFSSVYVQAYDEGKIGTGNPEPYPPAIINGNVSTQNNAFELFFFKNSGEELIIHAIRMTGWGNNPFPSSEYECDPFTPESTWTYTPSPTIYNAPTSTPSYTPTPTNTPTVTSTATATNTPPVEGTYCYEDYTVDENPDNGIADYGLITGNAIGQWVEGSGFRTRADGFSNYIVDRLESDCYITSGTSYTINVYVNNVTVGAGPVNILHITGVYDWLSSTSFSSGEQVFTYNATAPASGLLAIRHRITTSSGSGDAYVTALEVFTNALGTYTPTPTQSPTLTQTPTPSNTPNATEAVETATQSFQLTFEYQSTLSSYTATPTLTPSITPTITNTPAVTSTPLPTQSSGGGGSGGSGGTGSTGDNCFFLNYAFNDGINDWTPIGASISTNDGISIENGEGVRQSIVIPTNTYYLVSSFSIQDNGGNAFDGTAGISYAVKYASDGAIVENDLMEANESDAGTVNRLVVSSDAMFLVADTYVFDFTAQLTDVNRIILESVCLTTSPPPANGGTNPLDDDELPPSVDDGIGNIPGVGDITDITEDIDDAISGARGGIGKINDIRDAWENAPPKAIPNMPDCYGNPLDSEICALWYILDNTLLSGIGRAYVPIIEMMLSMLITLKLIVVALDTVRRVRGWMNK